MKNKTVYMILFVIVGIVIYLLNNKNFLIKRIVKSKGLDSTQLQGLTVKELRTIYLKG